MDDIKWPLIGIGLFIAIQIFFGEWMVILGFVGGVLLLFLFFQAYDNISSFRYIIIAITVVIGIIIFIESNDRSCTASPEACMDSYEP